MATSSRSGLRSPAARASARGTRTRPPRRVLDGVLLLDKPIGLSSHDALMRAKGMLRAKKAGHTGTLDPLASGLLPLCFGEATKFSQDLLDADKYYEATMRLGIRTDSGDAEGEVIETRDVTCDLDAVDAALTRFRGEIEQIPPMYSAVKRDGKPLYEYARAGKVVDRDPRRVTVHTLERISDAARFAEATEVVFRVHCSKGTYIRTLAEDIGTMLGCGAHLTALRRTRVGTLTIDDAVDLAALEARIAEADPRPQRTAEQEAEAGQAAGSDAEQYAVAPATVASDADAVSDHAVKQGQDDAARQDAALARVACLLQPVDALLSSFPATVLDAELARRFLHGQRLRLMSDATMHWPEGQSPVDPASAEIGRVRVYGPARRLLGTALLHGGRLAPERLVGVTAPATE